MPPTLSCFRPRLVHRGKNPTELTTSNIKTFSIWIIRCWDQFTCYQVQNAAGQQKVVSAKFPCSTCGSKVIFSEQWTMFKTKGHLMLVLFGFVSVPAWKELTKTQYPLDMGADSVLRSSSAGGGVGDQTQKPKWSSTPGGLQILHL